jgi:hypothetical protein
MDEKEHNSSEEAPGRETAEPPEGQQDRDQDEREDDRVDREAAETFPASDPPANY